MSYDALTPDKPRTLPAIWKGIDADRSRERASQYEERVFGWKTKGVKRAATAAIDASDV